MEEMKDFFDEFSFRGLWWLPKKRGEKIHGTLYYSPAKGCVLDLAESFHSIDEGKLVIYGRGESGQLITLWDCAIIERSFGTSNPLKLFCGLCLIGCHFNPNKSIFKYMEINYTGLEEWLGEEPVKCSHKKAWGLTISQKKPRSWRVKLPNTQTTISPYYDYICRTENSQHCFSLKTTPFLRIESKTNQSIEWFLQQHRRLKSMLTIFMGGLVFSKEIRVWSKAPSSKPIRCQLYFSNQSSIGKKYSNWSA